MALQIRRGTSTQLVNFVPAEGELIYTTDIKKLYVGDGSTAGGLDVSTAGGIGGLLSASINLNGFNIVGTGNLNTTGSLNTTGNIQSSGTITASSFQGQLQGNVIGNLAGSVFGDLQGSVFGSDSSVLVDSINNQLTGPFTGNIVSPITQIVVLDNQAATPVFYGTVAGTVIGDLYGNIVGADSTIMFNSDTSTIDINNIQTNEINSIGKLNIFATDSVEITSGSASLIRFTGVYDGTTQPVVDLHTIRGTIENPQDLQPGDFGTNLNFSTKSIDFSGFNIGKSLAVIIPQLDTLADINDDAPASNLILVLSAGDGNGDVDNNYMLFAFAKDGSFQSKIIQYVAQTASNISNITPVAGMVIFDSDTQKFKGYVSDIGLAGGGIANSTPGWVNLN